jgi:outer membrane protein OmpA-like peptidoglycan-associated protein
MQTVRTRQRLILASVLVAGLGVPSTLFADEHVRGVITAKESGTLLLQTDDAPMIVVLEDYTKVRRTDGMRQTRVNSSSLIAGLRIRAEGRYETPSRFVAEKVSFSRTDLKTALAIQGGAAQIDQRSRTNQQNIEQQAQVLQQHNAALKQQAQDIQSNSQKIIATTGALETVNTRIANLDEYDVIGSTTVYFRNASAALEGEYKSQLQQLTTQARSLNAYLFQVQGFASAVGATPRNQKLSQERAAAVVAWLQQNGVPLTSIVVPAAMGESQQIASNQTSKGQAENRRAVVTLLQNKGIAPK